MPSELELLKQFELLHTLTGGHFTLLYFYLDTYLRTRLFDVIQTVTHVIQTVTVVMATVVSN